MNANAKQVSGTHYKMQNGAVEHWDMVVQHKLNYFEGAITKYVMRARKKNGKQDLEKALHFLEKYLEIYDQLVEIGMPLGTPISDPSSKPSKMGSVEIISYGPDGVYSMRCGLCGENYRSTNTGPHACGEL
jgi:hypothetical protein